MGKSPQLVDNCTKKTLVANPVNRTSGYYSIPRQKRLHRAVQFASLVAGSFLLSYSTYSTAASSLKVRFIGQTDDGTLNSGQGFLVDNLKILCTGGGTLYQNTFTGSLGNMTATDGGNTTTNQWYYDVRNGGVARWGNPAAETYGTAGDTDNLDTPAINISACTSSLAVAFDYLINYNSGEFPGYDRAFVDLIIDGGTPTRIVDGTGAKLRTVVSDNTWHTFACYDSNGDMVLDKCGVPTVPAVPTDLTATVISANQIDLGWIDNSTDETGFKIESPAGTFPETTGTTATTGTTGTVPTTPTPPVATTPPVVAVVTPPPVVTTPPPVVTPAPVAVTPPPVVTFLPVLIPGANFSCALLGNIGEVCNYGGQEVTDLNIQGSGIVSNGLLNTTVVNTGWVSNFHITTTGKLSGGVVTGYIMNEGIMLDFDFKGMSVIGGTLGGVISNTSQVGGYFQNVTLQANTKITGGVLSGIITGDKNAPALLEEVRVKGRSKLSGVKLGKNVKLEKGVILEDKQ